MITIYQLLKESGVKFTKSDAENIGMRARDAAKPLRPKVNRKETYEGKKQTYRVNSYSDSDRAIIEETISNYFAEKFK